MSSGETTSAGREKKDGGDGQGGRGGYGSGLGDGWRLLGWWVTHLQQGRLCDLKKNDLKVYLYASIAITTKAVTAYFIWYKQNYDMAYKLDKSGEIRRTEIHRNNFLSLGL